MRPKGCFRTLLVVFLLLPTFVFGQDGYREIPRVPEPSGPAMPRERLSIGLNYTGGQVRWNFSPHWATELQYQQGKASSNYGDVKSQVYGLRIYRFFNTSSRFSLYTGPEYAYAQAKPETSSFRVKGFVLGAYGGLEYRVTKRISVDADLGPYVISLKETQTKEDSTNLDFVLNTAILWRLF
jgi:outer membrane protein with beta-barrel domain